MATFSCNRSHPQNPGLGGCSSAPGARALAAAPAPPPRQGSVPKLPLPALISPLLPALASRCFLLWPAAPGAQRSCVQPARHMGSLAAYSLAWVFWARGSGLELQGPQPSQGQFLVSACSPICDSSGASPSAGPMLGEGTARPGRAAGHSYREPTGPSAVGLWGACSGQPSRSCWCARGVWPDMCQQLSFISAFQSWCADLGDREPCVAVNHCQRLSLSHTGMELSQGRGPSRRSRALSWSRARQAG